MIDFRIAKRISNHAIYLLLILGLMVAFTFSGCSSGVTEGDYGMVDSNEQENQTNSNTATNDSYILPSEVGSTYEYDFFRLKDDRCYPIDVSGYNGDGSVDLKDGRENGGVFYRGDDPELLSYTVSKSDGERLVTNNNMPEFEFYPVVDMGYSESIRIYDYEEINGVSIGEIEDDNEKLIAGQTILQDEGFYFYSDGLLSYPSKKSFSVGKYSGTNFEEEIIEVSTPYVVTEENNDGDLVSYSVEPSKTKDGYFEIDLENIPNGIYLITRANADPSLIEIV